MAKKVDFIGAAFRVGKAVAADYKRAQKASIREHNAAIRRHNAAVRYQNVMERQRERDHKLAERENLKKQKEQAIQYALDRTNDSEQKRNQLISILKGAINQPLIVKWNSFKRRDSLTEPCPKQPSKQQIPPEIDEKSFNPQLTIIDKIFKKRIIQKIEDSKKQFESAIASRNEEITTIELGYSRLLIEFEECHSAWKLKKEKFEQEKIEFNEQLDQMEHDFFANKADAVEFYFDHIISSVDLPEELDVQWNIEYNSESKILILDFDLPNKEDIPNLKQMKYVSARQEFTETYLKDKEVDQLFEDMLFQLSLRITNDVYVSDINDQINSIVFNGFYSGINKSTGKEETKCVMSLQTQKPNFLDINVKNVDPKACFLKFKGVSGAKLYEFIPVAPVMAMDLEDRRFVESVDVAHMIQGMNLASMDWESFEHLIRELFEKEFAANGSEIRITKASRDGGVDAVMFDPDPIRGGKYVIQAKRYTNVVGVSAVRDLYGTLMNEGAVKGILVTTANYGADSYEFAKDKPITLINGNNLLHMLGKHGYNARIDLDEAKKMLK
jgi:restriction system protein